MIYIKIMYIVMAVTCLYESVIWALIQFILKSSWGMSDNYEHNI